MPEETKEMYNDETFKEFLKRVDELSIVIKQHYSNGISMIFMNENGVFEEKVYEIDNLLGYSLTHVPQDIMRKEFKKTLEKYVDFLYDLIELMGYTTSKHDPYYIEIKVKKRN